MSGLLGIAAGAANVSNAAQSVGRLLDVGAALTGGYLTPAMTNGLGPWAWSLQPASWRGIPFAVRVSRIQRGRRTALHEYPYRDVVWVEDLGLGKRTVSFQGFLVGDDVYAQRDAISSACDIPGPGNLVHPSLGSIEVVNVAFAAGESAERGRVVELDLTFIESGQDQPLFPTPLLSTIANVFGQAAAADLAVASDFLAHAASAITFGAAVLSAGVATVGGWVALGESVLADASLIAHCTSGLPGANFGRYASGKLTTQQPVGTTTATAIAALTVARAAAAVDISTAETALPSALPAAVQRVVADVLACAIDPADQVRLCSSLAAFQPVIFVTTAPIGAAIAAMQTAVGALCRGAALTALARACAAYQPSSYNDAAATLGSVTSILDSEIVAAADSGDTATYIALRTLRTAVAQDLTARGSLLPKLVTVTRGISLPSLVLAYQLYGDATRSDDLIARADPPNPLFMPLRFQALG